MLQNSHKKRTSQGPRRAPASSRTQVACINCKERKLKCDEKVPACNNCYRFNLTCLVEDPATKRHQPRNYLETLEYRVAFLEGLLQQVRPDIGSLSSADQLISNVNDTQTTTSNPKEEDDSVSDLAAKVGVLGLNAAGAEPYYLGSSSAFAFSRIINSSLRQIVTGKSTAAFGLTEEPTSTFSPCLLPDYETGVTLSNAYFHNIHHQYPFLHEPTFRHWEKKLLDPSEQYNSVGFDPVPLFFVNMVYAIGGLLLPNLGSLPQQLYISGQLYIDHVLSLDNLEAIQAILCCAMFSLRSSTGTSIWKLSGLALRQCIELGYHRNAKRFGPKVDPLRLELRKRAFWCAYGIDCAAAILLGRPLGVSLLEIDAEFPMDIDDLCITENGICGTPRTSPDDPPTTMSTAIHVFRLRCLWARMHTSLYSDVNFSIPDDIIQSRTEQLRAELEDWLASAPRIIPRVGHALSIFGTRDWYETNYNYCILILYRGPLTDSNGVTDIVSKECLQAAENICHSYRRQYIGKPVNHTWGTLHFLFMAGLTYLHCLWTSPTLRKTVRHDEVSSTCSDCTMVLVVMAERWKSVAPFRDLFEALASRTMTMMVDKNREEWILPTSSALLDDMDPEYLTQWMNDIADTGIPDGIDRILNDFVGDLALREQEPSSPGKLWEDMIADPPM